jgi:putative peptide zinc metalloprotease protein
MAYSFNHSLYIYPLDAASDQALVLCEVPAQNGSTIRLAMPADLLDLIRMFDGRRDVAQVFEAYDKLNPGKYSLQKVENLIRSFLLPKSLLVDLATPAFLPEISSKRASYVYAKVRLIPGDIVYPVAKLFGWAFKKWVLISWLAVFILAHVVFYGWIFPGHPTRMSHFTGSTFSLVMLLSLLGAFVHETGHASALVSYGGKQTEIGFGLYLYYPVLYTDVSEAWKLSRHRRAMIDIAGVYFQSVFQLSLLSLFLINPSPVFIYFFLFSDLIMFRTMNPFLRMDGYWLVADLFGIFNLREQSTNVIKHYVLKLFRSARAGRAPLQSLKPQARVALTVYSVLSATFFFYICMIMIRLSIVYLIPTYPTRLLAIWETTQARPFDFIKLLSLIFEVLWRTLVLCGLSIFAYRLVKGVFGLLRFVVQTLLQRFMKVFKLEEAGVEPVSSSGAKS